ncbi:unnamed protein product, partial [Mesorhabditis belari]|uniref:Uncharacterized protein n=1 Tax=Mesorhabditis belari TaxID=2138241 RepID=A0AAF3F3Q1_9BILA
MATTGTTNPQTAKNMYRVGDYVYIETSNDAPYAIRRIEELVKNANNSVEARVTCFYRRRDIEKMLLKVADTAERKFEEYYDREEKKDEVKPTTNGETEKGVKKEEIEKSEEIPQNGSSSKTDELEEKKVDEGKAKEDKEENDGVEELRREWGNAGLPLGADKLNGTQRHLFRQRELFLSRHQETVSCNWIRGRCMVTLLNEVEDLDCYQKDDCFFYSLVYDAANLTLLADKGTIRVGNKYQAEIPENVKEEEEDENKENGDALVIDEEAQEDAQEEAQEATSQDGAHRKMALTERERIIFHPKHSLTDQEIDQFLIIARAVGTFSRALDTNSSTRFPTLHMVAAAASRDVTLFHALALLHQAKYDLGQAVRYLCPPCNKDTYPFEAEKATGLHTTSLGGPILCRDQLEEWSTAESNLFEEALEKYGKDFHDMRNDYLPWKSVRDLVEYYYMWKTTNRYQESKKQKTQDQESKLKQVYIPAYSKPNQNLQSNSTTGVPIKGPKACESCQKEESLQWFKWGPQSASLFICQDCQGIWKKLASINQPHQHDIYDMKEPEREVAAKTALANADKSGASRVQPLNRGGSGLVIASVPSNHPALQASRATAEAGGSLNAQIAAATAAQISMLRGAASNEGALNLTTSGSSAADPKGAGKNRIGFTMVTNVLGKLARKLVSKEVLNLRRSARRPFKDLKSNEIRDSVIRTEPARLYQAANTIRAMTPQQFVTVYQSFMGITGAAKRPATDPVGAPAAKRAA